MNRIKPVAFVLVTALGLTVPVGFGESIKQVLKGTGQQIKTGSNRMEAVVKHGVRQNKATLKKGRQETKPSKIKNALKNPFKD